MLGNPTGGGRFTGKTVLVTGGGSGIGRAVTLQLAAEGARVAIVGRTAESLAATVAKAHAAGAAEGQVIEVRADLADLAGLQSAFAEILAEVGGLDVLINNAGVNIPGGVAEVDPHGWAASLDVNARATLFGIQAAVPAMTGRPGANVVNVSSIAGKGWQVSRSAAYVAAKAAVIGLTRFCATDLARFGIRVNAVCPGPTRNDAYVQAATSAAEAEGVPLAEIWSRFDASIPLGRSNEPSDIAEAVLFLASGAARNITGQSLNVDGGLVWD